MKNSKHLFRIGAAERKSLIILCYYILLGVVAFSAFTVTTRNGTLFAAAIAEYWRCESAGLGLMNLLLPPFAAPWLVENEAFLQDHSC